MAAGGRTEIGKTAWLSRGFEELLSELAKPQLRGYVFDVIIVGSGYGGSIAAAELAGCRDRNGRRLSVCVLERGREYLSGMFPSRFAEVPLHVRFSTESTPEPRGRRDGLFDLRIGADVTAVLANGLGGGSLINAGVMERPDRAMLRGWPRGVREDLIGSYYDRAERLLGAKGRTIGQHPLGEPTKLKTFDRLSGGRVRPAAISIGVRNEHNDAGIKIGECKRCGDCATGCNHGSKNSLDVNLLARAQAGRVRIFTGATVLSIARDGETWLVRTVHTEEALRKRQGKPAELRARKLILAAGTFGSTELLLRARDAGTSFSRCVGRRFSANGDSIGAIYNHAQTANAVADESLPADGRHIGPTITGMLDLRRRWFAPRFVIQEIAIPGPLRRVFEETVTIAKVLHELSEKDRDSHRPDQPEQDPCAVDAAALRRTSLFVIMGDDGARGELRLVRDGAHPGDGAIRVCWPELKKDGLFAAQVRALEKLAGRGGPGARVLPNPLWQLLPSSMQFFIDNARGPALTVHPLGGCPMGSSAADGAVDHLGRVFDDSDPKGERVFPGLVVLDGSIVRNALGINPALTIAALALRAVEGLRREWGFSEPQCSQPPQRARPVFRDLPRQPPPARPTEIEIVERMNGAATLRALDGTKVECMIELTLRFEKQSIGDLFLPVKGQPVPMCRTLRVRESESTLRVFLKDAWDAWRSNGEPEESLDDIAEVRATVGGVMRLLHREPSSYRERRCRSLRAWLLNRGLRDTWQAFVRGGERGGDWFRALWTLPQRVSGAFAVASRAGEVRRLDYRLVLAGNVWTRPGSALDTEGYRAGAPICGAKRLTYGRRSNPWRQLMRLKLSDFPGRVGWKPSLRLDEKFLAAQGVPLLKIVSQNDQVSALADVASFLAYFLRLLLNIHVWSFRRPDAPDKRDLDCLPPENGIPGRLPVSKVHRIPVDRLDGKDVEVKLTGYLQDREKSQDVPLLMIHGYSASGTTFAHHAVKPNMAEYFFGKGRDVWIVDMRTSSGMPTATHNWRFEQAAMVDIPMAVEALCTRFGAKAVDVFAHCMGSAMFSMAVLGQPDLKADPAHRQAQVALAQRVRRAVLSQIAPVLVMSPANIFRGYAMGYLRHFLPPRKYKFRVRPDADLVDQLLDRLLATLPYPEEEFDIENPPWPPWRRTPFAGTRHRMDALYGRDFSLADERGEALLGDAPLEYIDDLFGALSIETVSQAIHFARSEMITNHRGRNVYVLPRQIRQRWNFSTLSIHGEENGLADVATLQRFKAAFREQAGVEIETRAFPGFGHQDGLIGTKAEEVFREVHAFFEKPEDVVAAV